MDMHIEQGLADLGVSLTTFQSCHYDLRAWADIGLTDEQMLTLLTKEPDLVSLLVEYGETGGHGLDTNERDMLFNALAMHVLGRPRWPLSMDPANDHHALEYALSEAMRRGELTIDPL